MKHAECPLRYVDTGNIIMLTALMLANGLDGPGSGGGGSDPSSEAVTHRAWVAAPASVAGPGSSGASGATAAEAYMVKRKGLYLLANVDNTVISTL